MSIDKILVMIGGVGLISFVLWFFFGKKEETISAKNGVEILVDGGYKPSKLELKLGKKSTLSFLRTDKNSCLEEIVIPDFKIKKYLPVGKKVDIEIVANKKGKFDFHCGMNMYRGQIIVK